MSLAFPGCFDALEYAERVASGEQIAGRLERLACERFIKDLEREDLNFDPQAAEEAIEFIESLPHTKGDWAKRRELLSLGSWQKFIVANIFGFKNDDGNRRFRKAFLLIARKNGKSALAAAIGLYMFCADGEFGAEVYSGATTEKQAWEVFRPAKQMAMKTPERLEYLNFTEPYLEVPTVVLGRIEAPFIERVGDLRGQRIGVVEGSRHGRISPVWNAHFW